MSGQLLLETLRSGCSAHARGILLEGGRALRFRDPRRFGRWSMRKNGKRFGKTFDNAGIDPLSPEFDAAGFRGILKAARGEIKRLLLDQSRIAGLGNIYVCEALHRAAVSPFRRASGLSEAEGARLHAEILAVLDMALRSRGTTLLDYRDAGGGRGGFQRMLLVYGREGRPCERCRAPVARRVQGGGARLLPVLPEARRRRG